MTETEFLVLRLIAQDEDYESLVLLLDEFKESRPELSDADASRAVIEAAKVLLEKGLIHGFVRKMIGGDFQALSPAECLKAIERIPNWYPSERETAIVSLAPTSSGERALKSQR